MRRSAIHAKGSLIFLLAILILSGAGVGASGTRGIWIFPGLSLLSFVWLAAGRSLTIPVLQKFNPFKSLQALAGRPFFSGSAVILILMAVYYFNPTHRWMDGVGALPIQHIPFLPGSAFLEGTQCSLLFVITALATAGLTRSLGRRNSSLLLTIISVGGALTAWAALGQRLTPRLFPVFETTGFFVYENHFAAFANLILPVALACGTRAQSRAFQAGKVSSPAGLYYWMAFLFVAAVALSRSRAGILISGLILFSFFLLRIRLRRQYPFILPSIFLPVRIRWGLTVATGGTAISAVVFYVWHGFAPLVEQFTFRWQVVTDTFAIFKEHLWWGTGPGSFAAVFPYYQTLPVAKHFFAHAHCEPIEFLSEYGLLGSGVVLGVGAWIVFFGRRRESPDQRSPSFRELEGAGLRLALAGIGLHGLLDFPLRHPLNALLTAVWISILAGRLPKEKTENDG